MPFYMFFIDMFLNICLDFITIKNGADMELFIKLLINCILEFFNELIFIFRNVYNYNYLLHI